MGFEFLFTEKTGIFPNILTEIKKKIIEEETNLVIRPIKVPIDRIIIDIHCMFNFGKRYDIICMIW